MAQGFLNISHNFAGESQFIVVEWVRSTAQGAPVPGSVTGTGLGVQDGTTQTQVFYPTPHINEQLQVTQLPEVWFLVRFWRSADGVSKDALLLELAGNARTGALYPITRYEYVVDRGYDNTAPVVTEGVWSDPVQDDTGIRDTRLLDQTYWVQERGTGDLLAAEINDRSDLGGGFDFVEAGKVMNSGGVYIVTAINRIDLAGDDSGAPSSDDDIFILTSDQDYAPLTMAGKTLVADFPGTVGTLTLPNLLLLSNGKFTLDTNLGSQRNVVLQLDAGDTVRFMGEDVNKIILGQSESIDFVIKDNVLYALKPNTNHQNLGVVKYAYKLLLNTLPQDGSLLLHADYPRVQELLDSLPAGEVVNETTWQTSSVEADGVTVYANKGKWMSEGANFRTPDLRNQTLKVLATMIAGTVAGTYEHQRLLDHYHAISSGTDNGGSPYLSSGHLTGGNAGYDLAGSSVEPLEFRTGVPRGHTSGSAVGDAAQKVNSTLLYLLICI